MPSAQDEDLEAVAGRLREAVAAAGGPTKVAEAADIPLGTLNKYLSGKTEPGAMKLQRLAQVLPRTLTWILTGRGVKETSGTEMVLLPHFPTQPSAGKGALAAPSPYSDGSVAFSSDWLRLIGVNPRKAHVLTARGDSMEPTIRDGDLLVVDRSIDRVVDAGIYVCTVGGMVVVKRVQIRRDGTLVLKSDNGHYDDEVIPPSELESVAIEGRVCWSGRPM